MHVHLWNRMLDGAKKIAVEKSVEVARQPALNTDFRGATFPGFTRATNHIPREESEYASAAPGPAAKAAETASTKQMFVN